MLHVDMLCSGLVMLDCVGGGVIITEASQCCDFPLYLQSPWQQFTILVMQHWCYDKYPLPRDYTLSKVMMIMHS